MKKKFLLWAAMSVVVSMLFTVFDTNMSVDASEKNSVETNLNVKGATIWPVENLTMYDSKNNLITKIEAGTPMVALAQANGKFKVYYDNKVGYISSDSCMINLPDVLQEEMQYDITNSYSSIYKIHQEPIEGVTGEVLYPYAMVGEDEYLVPLLFPVAQRLYDAEAEAISKGYTLKVYDAYRPYSVSTQIYSTMMEFLEENPIYAQMMSEPVNGVTYGPSNFLNKGVSFHNYGVAVDITLVDLATGKELAAQAQMHELSTRSVQALNNDTADTLKEIMLGYGFTTINSEWWHFEIRSMKKAYAKFQAKPLG